MASLIVALLALAPPSFPTESAEISHFLKLLNATAPRLTDRQEALLHNDLKGKLEPTAKAADPAARDTDLVGDALPAGAIARLGTVRFRQSGSHAGLAFAADGQTLISFAERHPLSYWEFSTGKRLRTATTPPNATFRSFSSSRDGRRVALIGWLQEGDAQPNVGIIWVWDVNRGTELKTIRWKEREQPVSTAFHADGRTLIVTGSDSTLRCYDLDSGDEVFRYKLADLSRNSGSSTLICSSLGMIAATTSRSDTVYLWQWPDALEPATLKVGERCAGSLAFSPDGRTLACGGFGAGPLELWNVVSGKRERRIPTDDSTRDIRAVAYSPDGKRLASISYSAKTINLWDVATGTHVRKLSTGSSSAWSVVFSPDSSWIAAATGHDLRRWNVTTGEELVASTAAHQGAVNHVAFSPRNDTVFTASEDGTVRGWEAATGRQLYSVPHGHWVRGFALSPDGSRLASSSLDDTVRLIDAQTGREIYRLPGHGRLGGCRALRFSPDGQQFFSWGDDFHLRKWNVKNGKALFEQKLHPTGVDVADDDDEDRDKQSRQAREFLSLGPAEFTPDCSRFLLGINRGLHVFDATTGQETGILPHEDGDVVALAISSDGQAFLTSAWGRFIEIPLADGTVRGTSARNNACRLRELATGKDRLKIDIPDSGAGPVAFSADGRTIAVGVTRPTGKVSLYEIPSGRLILTLNNIEGLPRCLAFSRDGKLLATGLEDTTVLIWDLKRVAAR